MAIFAPEIMKNKRSRIMHIMHSWIKDKFKEGYLIEEKTLF